KVFWDYEQGILSANPDCAARIDAGIASEVPHDQAPKVDTPLALVYPAFDLALKCSHVFNLLDARGAVGVTERAAYINRIRARVRACCLKHMEQYKDKKDG